MGNPQHLDWLLEGVEAWNARRRNPLFKPDLSKANINEHFNEAKKLNADGRIDLKNFNLDGVNLSESVIIGALLNGATLNSAVCIETVFDGADLRSSEIENANFSGASLVGANFRGAKTSGLIVRTSPLSETKHTDLSVALRLTQDQLVDMLADQHTVTPKELDRPANWPPFEPAMVEHHPAEGAQDPAVTEASNPPGLNTKALELNSFQTFELVARQRSASELRQALQASYQQPAALAAYMVEQLQREISAHQMTAIPNGEPEASQYFARLNFLEEMKASVLIIHEHLPTNFAPRVSVADAATIKEKLIELASQIDRAIKWLDEDGGTYGNLWKLSVISLASGLMCAVGFAASAALPVATGVVAANTFRLSIQRK